MKLDLSGLEHVKSDDKSTYLKHKDGHEIRVMHNVLSKDAQAQLKALADGAKRKESDHGKVTVKEDKEEPIGKVKMMANGGEAEAKEIADSVTPDVATMQVHQPTQQEKLQEAYNAQSKETTSRYISPDMNPYASLGNIDANEIKKHLFGADGAPPEQFDPNTAKQAITAVNAASQGAMEQKAKDTVQSAETNALGAQFGIQPVPGSPGIAPSPTSDQTQQGLAAVAHQPNPMDATENSLMSGLNMRMKGINQAATAQGALGEEQSKLLEQQAKAQTDAQVAYNQQVSSLNSEREGLIQDIKDGHVDPNRFWTGDPKTGEGGHSKIMAGIGMILAGFNPTNNPNMAIQFLQKQMDRDLEAQAKNLQTKQSLLSANMQQYGNIKDATMATRIMQNDVLQHQLQEAAAKAQNPLAKAAAMEAAGKLQMEAAPMMQQFAMRRAMMNMADNQSGDPTNTAAAEHMLSYMRAVNPEMAKEMESRLVPGVGMSKIPLPEKVRDEITAHKQFSHAAQDLEQWTKSHTTLVPGTADYTTGVAKAQQFQALIREGLLNTVYREGEQPLLDKMIKGNPANLLKEFNTIPQLKELQRANDSKFNDLKNTYGLPASRSQTTAPPTGPVPGADGRQYQEQIINGKKYYVPVK